MTRLDDYHTISIENESETFTLQNKYKIIRKIGSGSYGSVISAINVTTNEGNKKLADWSIN